MGGEKIPRSRKGADDWNTRFGADDDNVYIFLGTKNVHHRVLTAGLAKFKNKCSGAFPARWSDIHRPLHLVPSCP